MIYETSITNPKKQLEFYKDLSEQLQQENEELKKQLEKKYEKVGTLTAEILYEENTRLVNEITVLKIENQKLNEQLKIKHDGFMASIEEKCELAEENQKLKELQCAFQGTGCQNKMKKYKEVIGKIRKICESVPVSWSVCGIDVVAKIEKALKEVE